MDPSLTNRNPDESPHLPHTDRNSSSVNPRELELLGNIRAHITEIEEVLERLDGQIIDGVYRLYHGSFKVLSLHGCKQEMYALLAKMAPNGTRLSTFLTDSPGDEPRERLIGNQIVQAYAMPSSDEKLIAQGRRLAEAVLHAKLYIELAACFGRCPDGVPENPMPSGWALLLELYQIR